MSQGFIYHLIPENLQGNTLIPLNEMKGELYEGHAKKYAGREALMEVNIPLLNCLWNDVVQFSALHPQIIVNHLLKIQGDLNLRRLKVLRIPIETAVSKYNAVVFHGRTNKKKGDYGIHPDEVFVLEESFKEVEEIPVATLEFWELAKRGEVPFLWFPYVPHIFIKGSVEISDGDIIQLTVNR